MKEVWLTEECFGRCEDVPVDMIEAICTLACELQMLALIVTDGHMSCPMDQDISGLQHRVGKQSQLQLRL